MPILYVFMSLGQLHLHDYLVFTCLTRDDATLNRFAIYDDLLHSLLLALWVFHGEDIEQVIPIVVEFSEGGINFFGGVKLSHQFVCLFLIDHLLGYEFLVLLVLHVSQEKDQVPAFSRLPK